jgi:hypothetical protein
MNDPLFAPSLAGRLSAPAIGKRTTISCPSRHTALGVLAARGNKTEQSLRPTGEERSDRPGPAIPLSIASGWSGCPTVALARRSVKPSDRRIHCENADVCLEPSRYVALPRSGRSGRQQCLEGQPRGQLPRRNFGYRIAIKRFRGFQGVPGSLAGRRQDSKDPRNARAWSSRRLRPRPPAMTPNTSPA